MLNSTRSTALNVQRSTLLPATTWIFMSHVMIQSLISIKWQPKILF